MNRTIAVLNKRPFLALALSVLVAIPLGALVVAATPPDPGVRELPMSWQTVPEPFLNTGVDKYGLTLEQWTRGTNRQGMTLEDWTIAGNPPRTWVADPKTRRRPQDWQPLLTYTAKAGGRMRIGRYMEFTNKMAEPKIHRRFVCGAGVNGISDYTLDWVPPPSRTDGAAVKNHETPVPKEILPDGVNARACEYRASAEFATRNPMRSAWLYFPPVPVTIVR